ncbi:hypothetical protein AVEN_15230-1 [Araneus ventricosus]|uniref:Uncharacterized protein n=1 Tax=Araneus ventricosus TaxID=182803 RepID=A0A4Y2RGC6_ARAVE|nr:hypothetical protein AVEN_253160-1 [Araneus ventricosus]GBN74436.1 hypothetical protein AVEN_15230-1 [Araneus ventricosus]
MTRTTPELAAPSPNFLTGLVARRLAPDVRFGVQQAHARWIFSGIGFRNWNPQAPRGRDLTTRPPRPFKCTFEKSVK